MGLQVLPAGFYAAFAAMGVGAHIAAQRMLFGPLSYITWVGVLALEVIVPMVSGFLFAKYRYSGYALVVIVVLVMADAPLLRYAVLASSVLEPIGLL